MLCLLCQPVKTIVDPPVYNSDCTVFWQMNNVVSDTWIFPFSVHSPIRCTQAWSGRIGGHRWSCCHSTSTCQRSHGTISSVSVINCEWVRLREVFVWNYIHVIWQDLWNHLTLCNLFFLIKELRLYVQNKLISRCLHQYMQKEASKFTLCSCTLLEKLFLSKLKTFLYIMYSVYAWCDHI